MGWVRLWGVLKRRELTQRAAELAVAASGLVRDRSIERARGMERAEARGYVRAKSTPVISALLDTYARRHPSVSRTELDWLRATMAEQIVQLVMEDVIRAKVPALRRAA